MPTFFIPGIKDSAAAERLYASFAQAIGRPVPPRAERIYEMEFTHDGVVWTARVGERLRGVRYERRRGKPERRYDVSDDATVLAIFPDAAHHVFIDSPPFGAARTQWGNPFLGGQRPHSITHFDPNAAG